MLRDMPLVDTPQRPGQPGDSMSLADLPIGVRARIVRIGGKDDALQQRLLEIGFEEGGEVEVAYEGFIRKDPMAVRVHGMLVALRRREASAITVAPA